MVSVKYGKVYRNETYYYNREYESGAALQRFVIPQVIHFHIVRFLGLPYEREGFFSLSICVEILVTW